MGVYCLYLIACLQVAYYCAYGIYLPLSLEFEGYAEAKSKLLTTDALPNTTAKKEYSMTLYIAKAATMKTTQSTTGTAVSTPTVTSLPTDVSTSMTSSTSTNQSPSVTTGTISSSSVSSTAFSSTSSQSQTTLRTTLKTSTTLSSATTLSPTTLLSPTTQQPTTAIASNLTKQSHTTTFSTTTQLLTTASNPTTQSPITISSTTTQSPRITSSPTTQSHTTTFTTIQSASTTSSSITQPPRTASSPTAQSHTTTSSTTTQSQTTASTTSTKHLPMNVTRRKMSFQISLNLDEKQDFLNTDEYAKVVDGSNKILFTMYQIQLGSNFKKLQMKSVRFGPLMVDYNIFVENSPSTLVNVVNLMKNISAGKTNMTYNGKDVRVLFVSYTDSTNNQVLINNKTDPKAVIESSFVCTLDESCERTSDLSNADKDDIPTCIIISIAVVTALIVTCAFTITMASMICARKIKPKDRRQYTLVPSHAKVPV